MEYQLRKVCASTFIAMLAIVGMSITPGAPVANGLGSAKPTLIEDKFELPTDEWVVTEEWVSRGFTRPEVKAYPRGWSRAEHAHPYSLLITPISGRMEFVIADQRVVIEPGDELFYPARAVMLARNLYDGDSEVLISRRR